MVALYCLGIDARYIIMDGLWIISAAVADAWRFLLLIWLSLFSDVIIEQTAVVCFVVSTEKKPPKRPLKVRISEETREILKNPMGLTRDCLGKRLKAVREKVHKVIERHGWRGDANAGAG